MAAVRIAGLEELRRQLAEFPKALQERATAKGVRKASATLRTALRRGAYAAPLAKGYKRTNRLRNSLRSAVARKPGNKGKAWVGLKKIPGTARPLSYYKTLETGRKPYSSKKRGAVRGSFPMRPFFRRTWEANKIMVGNVLVEETRKALAYEAARAFAKSKVRR